MTTAARLLGVPRRSGIAGRSFGGGRGALLVPIFLWLASCAPEDCNAPAVNPQDLDTGITRGPQVALVGKDSVTIAWQTEAPRSGAIEYGADSSYGNRVEGLQSGTEHAVSLQGLAPGARYLYRVAVDGVLAREEHGFTTAPEDPQAPCRFVVFGDCGSGCQSQFDIAAGVLAAQPDLVLITGDVVYESAAPSEITPRYFVPYADLIDHIPFYITLGNHDLLSDDGQSLLEALHLPVNDRDQTERFYSFDRGDIHFVVLNSNSGLESGGDQLDWVEADLSRSTATWNFVFVHHPPFSSSRHGSIAAVRESLCPLLDAYQVDIVFSGNDHNYERTFPLRDGEGVDVSSDPDYVDPEGTIYIVTGGGGKSLYESGRSYFTAHSRSSYHFVAVDVEGPRLTLKAIRRDGGVFDQISIAKTGE